MGLDFAIRNDIYIAVCVTDGEAGRTTAFSDDRRISHLGHIDIATRFVNSDSIGTRALCGDEAVNNGIDRSVGRAYINAMRIRGGGCNTAVGFNCNVICLGNRYPTSVIAKSIDDTLIQYRHEPGWFVDSNTLIEVALSGDFTIHVDVQISPRMGDINSVIAAGGKDAGIVVHFD